MSPARYVQEAVSNCKICLSSFCGNRYRLSKKAENPFKMGYDPELDTSPVLDLDAASYYLTIIGILRWMVELARMDIITKVSLLSSHVALPREGHLEEQCMLLPMLARNTTPDKYMILPIQK